MSSPIMGAVLPSPYSNREDTTMCIACKRIVHVVETKIDPTLSGSDAVEGDITDVHTWPTEADARRFMRRWPAPAGTYYDLARVTIHLQCDGWGNSEEIDREYKYLEVSRV